MSTKCARCLCEWQLGSSLHTEADCIASLLIERATLEVELVALRANNKVLTGDDADRLLEDLEKSASPEEMKRRIEAAGELLKEMTRPKGFAKKPAGG